VRDNIVFALWELEPKLFDIIEWIYAKNQEYVNSALTLALTRRIKLTSKEPKIPRPIQNILKKYDPIKNIS